MDNKGRNLLAPMSVVCLGLLLVASVNFRPAECKSMPIDQQHYQQMSPFTSPKIPMIFLSKPRVQQPQLQAQQQQQQSQQLQFQPQPQYQRQDSRQAPNSSPITSPPNNSAEPSGPMTSPPVGQQQRREPIRSSASYVSEISAAPSAMGRQKSQGSQAAIERQAKGSNLAQNVAEVDEGDNDQNDESDIEDEPAAAAVATAASSLGPLRPRKFSQEAGPSEGEQEEQEPTRRSWAGNRDSATLDAVTRYRYKGPQESERRAQPSSEANDESAIRKEQENAEASEAEVADRSALDEQQQQQREIILAQAQSEAKAIKEQQEALMRQQALQQQMIMRRQSELNDRNNRSSHSGYTGPADGNGRSSSASMAHRRAQKQQPTSHSGNHLSAKRQRQQQSHLDEQLEGDESGKRYQGKSVSQDEDADYSFRRPLAVPSVGSIPKYGVNDLLPAAQHSYGAHFGSLKGHQKDYNQFAESFKEGQFHSGYKRGGNKFQISGHASQHKSHAEGHVKWNGYKGKGVSYWNYQHSDKKPYFDYHH